MTKLTTATALGLVLTALSLPARADVTVTADLEKTKTVDITLEITKTKTVDITVGFNQVLTSAAEAHALVNVTNTGNNVDKAAVSTLPDIASDLSSGPDYGIHLDAEITGSINANTGIVGVNQDVGNMVNQSNVVAVAAITRAAGDTTVPAAAFTDSEAWVDQSNTANTETSSGSIDNPDDPTPQKIANIAGSVNGNSGIVGVNQNAGNMNNQTNAVSLSVGFGAVLALSDAALGQENSNNTVKEFETVKTGTVAGSFNGNTGIISGNQSTGNMNNQGNSIAFSALTSTAAIGVPGS